MNDTPNTIEIDGMICDAETGEIIGMAGKPEFRVQDEESLAWVTLSRYSAY